MSAKQVTEALSPMLAKGRGVLEPVCPSRRIAATRTEHTRWPAV